MCPADVVRPVGADPEPQHVGDDQQRRVLERQRVLPELLERGVEAGTLSLVLPGEVIAFQTSAQPSPPISLRAPSSKQSSRRKGRPRPASAPQGAPPRPDRLARREPRPPGDHARRNDGGSVEPWTVDVPAVFVLKREFQVTRTTLERPQKDPSGSLARKKGRRRRRKFRGFGGSVVQRCHPGQAKWKSRLTGAAT